MPAHRKRDDATRERENRKWWESRARSGKASICPECGGYTTRDCGYHLACAKEAGVE